MQKIAEEIQRVEKQHYRLQFKIPTETELKKLRKIHRDRTADEKAKIKKAEEGLKDFLQLVKRGEVAPANLPPDLRTALAKLLQQESEFDDETDL